MGIGVRGGRMCSKLGAQLIIEAETLGAQYHHFIYYQPKYWVCKCVSLRIRFRRPWGLHTQQFQRNKELLIVYSVKLFEKEL